MIIPSLTRRQAIQIVTGIVGFMTGERVLKGDQSAARQQYVAPKSADLRLVLDGTAGIEVVYQGQRQRITPEQIMGALARKD